MSASVSVGYDEHIRGAYVVQVNAGGIGRFSV